MPDDLEQLESQQLKQESLDDSASFFSVFSVSSWLRRSDQIAVWFLILISAIGIGAYVGYQVIANQRLIDIDEVPQRKAEFQVDINSADWPEFSNLPGIGDDTARRIVMHREQHGPFRSIEQLKEVRGIGTKKLEQIRKYLKPTDGPFSTDANPSGE